MNVQVLQEARNEGEDVTMPDALGDGFIYEFLSAINLDLTLAVRDWTRKESEFLRKQIEKEIVSKKAANPSIEDVKKEYLDRKGR